MSVLSKVKGWFQKPKPEFLYIIQCEKCASNSLGKTGTLSAIVADSPQSALLGLPKGLLEPHKGHKVCIYSTDGKQDEDVFEVLAGLEAGKKTK